MIALRSAALAIAAAAVIGAPAQQPFRSGVDLVRVDALVTDDRRPIAGLTPADFELRDNGVLQSLDSVALESLPLSVVFVLDTSGSVAGSKMQHLASAVDVVLNGLAEQDRAALVTFSHRIWMRTSLSADRQRLRGIITNAEAIGGTALHDAVYAGLAIGEGHDARPLVLVFSDGLDNASWLSAQTVERAAQRADAVVYGVAVAASTTVRVANPGASIGRRTTVVVPRYTPGQTDFLEDVASATGGRVIKSDTSGDVEKAFGDILREFRTRYLITYSPRGVDTPGWHTIDVKLKGRRGDVQARRGYQK